MHYQTQMGTPDVAKLRGEEAADYLRARVRSCAAEYLAYPPAILTAQFRRAGLPVAGGQPEGALNAPWTPERFDFGAMNEEQRGLAAAILAQNIHDDMVIGGANDANLQAGIREYDGFSPQAILAMLSGVSGLMKSWTATVTVAGANVADAMAAEHTTLAKSHGGRRSSAGHGLLYLSRVQVAEVCAPCAEEMTRKGLSHLAVDALVKAIVGGGEADALRKAKGADDIESFRFGDEGSFARCVSALDGRKGVDNAESLCAYLHKQVTGEWPAQKSIRGRGPLAALDAMLPRRAE